MNKYLYEIKKNYCLYKIRFISKTNISNLWLEIHRMEKVSMQSKSAKAKVLGTFVCIGGALILILYKGIPLINPQSHKVTTPASASSLKKWIIGSIFLTASCVFWSSWFLIQEKVGKKYPYRYSSTAITSFFATIQSAILNLIIHRNNAKWILKGKLQIMTVVYSVRLSCLITKHHRENLCI